MTILKYLKDRWLLLIGWLFFLFLTCFILWLAPNVRLDWTVVGYIFYCKVFLSLFLTIDYYLKRKWWLFVGNGKTAFFTRIFEYSRKKKNYLSKRILTVYCKSTNKPCSQLTTNRTKKITLTLGFMKSKSP